MESGESMRQGEKYKKRERAVIAGASLRTSSSSSTATSLSSSSCSRIYISILSLYTSPRSNTSKAQRASSKSVSNLWLWTTRYLVFRRNFLQNFYFTLFFALSPLSHLCPSRNIQTFSKKIEKSLAKSFPTLAHVSHSSIVTLVNRPRLIQRAILA